MTTVSINIGSGTQHSFTVPETGSYILSSQNYNALLDFFNGDKSLYNRKFSDKNSENMYFYYETGITYYINTPANFYLDQIRITKISNNDLSIPTSIGIIKRYTANYTYIATHTTLQDGINNLSSGQILELERGFYRENIETVIGNNGTISNNTIIRAKTGHSVIVSSIIDSPSFTANGNVYEYDYTSQIGNNDSPSLFYNNQLLFQYSGINALTSLASGSGYYYNSTTKLLSIRIEGDLNPNDLDIVLLSNDSKGVINLHNNVEYIKIKDIIFHGDVQTKSMNNITFERCTFNYLKYGIHAEIEDDDIWVDCLFKDCEFVNHLDIHNFNNIQTVPASRGVDIEGYDNIVENCYFHGLNWGGLGGGTENNINHKNTYRYCTFENCMSGLFVVDADIHHNLFMQCQNAIRMRDTEYAHIYRNLIHDMISMMEDTDFILGNFLDYDNLDNILVEQNTVIAPYILRDRSIDKISNSDFINNLFVSETGGYFSNSLNNGTNTMTNNLLYSSKFFNYNYNFGNGEIYADPLLNSKKQLTNISPAKNAGSNSVSAVALETPNDNIDIGAYEYGTNNLIGFVQSKRPVNLGNLSVLTMNPPALPTIPTTDNEVTVGASGADYTSFIDAWNNIGPNYTIILENGEYIDSVTRTFTEYSSTTEENPIVVKARNPGQATLKLTGTGDQWTFRTSNLWFVGVNIHGNGTTGLGNATSQSGGRLIRFNQGSESPENLYIINCDIGNTVGHGIYLINYDNILIQDTDIHDIAKLNPNNTRNCITTVNVNNIKIYNCNIYNCEHELISTNGSNTTNFKIEYNKLYNCSDHAITLRDGNGFRIAFNTFWNDPTNIYLNKSDVDETTNDAIFVHKGCGGVDIIGNNFSTYGRFINIKGDASPPPSGIVRIYNNSGYEAGSHRGSPSLNTATEAIRYKSITNALTVDCKNNMWYSTSPSELDSATIYANYDDGTHTALTRTLDYNLHLGGAVNKPSIPAGSNSVENTTDDNPFLNADDYDDLNFSHNEYEKATGKATTSVLTHIPEWNSVASLNIGSVQFEIN